MKKCIKCKSSCDGTVLGEGRELCRKCFELFLSVYERLIYCGLTATEAFSKFTGIKASEIKFRAYTNHKKMYGYTAKEMASILNVSEDRVYQRHLERNLESRLKEVSDQLLKTV